MILVAGEALIDLTRAVPGESASETYTAHPGGGPCNTAVALGRLGIATGFLGALSTDAFGERLMEHLGAAGVDTSRVTRTARPTTLAMADVDDDGQATYAFYMDGTSAAQLYPHHVPDPLDASVEAIHVGTLGLVLEPTGTSIVAMVVREAGRRVIAVDPNIRRAVIPDMDTHRARLDTVMRRADIVRISANSGPAAKVEWRVNLVTTQ
jgi:fructokinase